jgi:hypothetical protein
MLVVLGAGLTRTAAGLATAIASTLPSGGDSAKKEDAPPPGSAATPAMISDAISNALHGPPEAREENERKIGEVFEIYFSPDNRVRIYREGTFGE